MNVKIEDFLSREVRHEKFAVANFVQLAHQLESANKHLSIPVRILAHHRSRFIEVWSSDGQLLIARYTPCEN
ncbi:MAG TPA: hypothetical protein VK530_08165 [Candidatus Acidoferrum sp.]|nr:hypothetical protein [Candidatus Acidoferrum sp.]